MFLENNATSNNNTYHKIVQLSFLSIQYVLLSHKSQLLNKPTYFLKNTCSQKTVPHQIITRITKFYNFHFKYSQCSTHLTNYNNKRIKTV
jgi:hypothetical protein